MANSNSKYGSFLENFDKGNTFLQSAAEGFINQANIDKLPMLNSSDKELSQSFSSVENILSNRTMDNYEKMNQVGNLLAILTPQIIHSTDSVAKKSGKNIINTFFNVAKKTEDQQMLGIANDIARHL